MRFGLRHIFAVTTLFAILVAVGNGSDVIRRDGIWIVESVDERWGGSWSGADPVTGAATGGSVVMYVAQLRDGDRVRSACVGNSMERRRSQLPAIGDSFVFTGAEIPLHNPISPRSSMVTVAPPRTSAYFAVDDHTLVRPARATDGYSPVLNVLAAFIMSVVIVVSGALIYNLVRWFLGAIEARWERKQEILKRHRRTRIV